ncbi:hypothetical protein [Dysgonomonas gadei]|uniref:Uncharacterized protein n=1 Tax=Dysgonomonas gadei ATCC BAA-286 TaxID=742766 RepID=F5IX84_9BACT|nr:hypothetical protein [Dysgonomonas gadei]EGK02431.1 hypothetical protein HMPREF9455_01701 [Dysgonomonas gadei ATCC BAA-286]
MNKATKKIKTWKNGEGNLCFSYDMRQPMEKPWIIVIIGVFFFCVVTGEYLHVGSTYSLSPLILLFMFIFLYWAFYPCKSNEVIEEMMMNKNVDLRLHNELKKFDNDVYEVRRKFYQDSKGTYGIVTGTYMLVLLSNDEVLEYELKYHKPTETESAYFEFLKRPVKCINTKHRKAIETTTIAKLWAKIKIPERVIFLLIIFVIIGISAGLAFLYLWLMTIFEWRAIAFFIGYIVVFMAFQSLIGKSQNKILKSFNFIVSRPIGITIIWFELMFPAMTILMSYMCLGVYAFGIPILVVKSVDFLFNLNMSWETLLFIMIAIGSIVSVHGAKLIHWIIKEHSPLKNWENHKYEAVKTELALYVINKNNVNFLIYLAYFVYLSISGFLQVQYNESLITTDVDGAILKAFLVFIAFSNMVNKSKDVEIKAKPLLSKMIRLMTTHDK